MIGPVIISEYHDWAKQLHLFKYICFAVFKFSFAVSELDFNTAQPDHTEVWRFLSSAHLASVDTYLIGSSLTCPFACPDWPLHLGNVELKFAQLTQVLPPSQSPFCLVTKFSWEDTAWQDKSLWQMLPLVWPFKFAFGEVIKTSEEGVPLKLQKVFARVSLASIIFCRRRVTPVYNSLLVRQAICFWYFGSNEASNVFLRSIF